ncbi:DUF6440 family protein [Cohaesibacter marisflavi]|uniref:DUF6440 family protein n=1 Tax=Cohaesibacter marisflavi TaxID=655353 RepID=UPI0029C76D85|nr:DUF6440 family protein [Cohaesibacter marisflavi]
METIFYLFGTIAFICFIGFVSPSTKSDDSNGAKKSGMTVYTDYKTGCQYLGTWSGGITPRLDADGKQVCIEEQREVR